MLTVSDTKVIYRRYASLFFITSITPSDNELITLEVIHRYVEVLDRYFGNVSSCVAEFVPLKLTLSRCASSTSSSTSRRHMRCVLPETATLGFFRRSFDGSLTLSDPRRADNRWRAARIIKEGRTQDCCPE